MKKLTQIIYLIIPFLISACTTQKQLPEDWCDDLYIPNTMFYKEAQKYDYEIPPLLKASEILPEHLRHGDNFDVQEDVYSDGVLDHFQINTKWGTFRVAGTYKLKARINEINAIDKLSEISAGGAAAKGLVGGVSDLAVAPFKAIGMLGNAIISPIKTTNKIASATNNAVSNDYDLVDENEAKNNNYAQEEKFEEPILPKGTKTRRLEKLLDKERALTTFEGISNDTPQGKGFFSELLGFTKQVTEIQKKFNLDPNTDNEILRDQIRRVARIQAGGGLSLSLVPGGSVFQAISATGSAVDIVDNISIYDDEKTQRRKVYEGLSKIGVSKDDIKRFEAAPGLSTYVRTKMANYILYLKGVKNRQQLVEMASVVDDYEIGWIMLQTYAALVNLYDKEDIERFINDTPLPSVLLKDGRVITAVAADHLYWTFIERDFFIETVEAIKEDLGKLPSIEIQITGIPSEMAIKELKNLGYKVTILEDPDKYNF